MIEHIKHLASELQIETLCDLRILGNGEIGIHEPRTDDGISSEVPRMADSRDTWRDKYARIFEPLRRISSCLYGAGYIWPDCQGNTWSRADCPRRVDRISTLGLSDNAELPTSHSSIALEGQFIETTQHKSMASIEFGWAIVAARVISVLNDIGLARGQGIVIERFRIGVRAEEL